MSNALDFVIAGAQKGGTTQLAALLSRVKGVWMRDGEDPAFESPHFERGEVDRLLSEIKVGRGEAKIAGIKRASYLGIEEVPSRIRQTVPDCKVVLILRDPVDRAVSAYFHKAQYGRVRLMPAADAFSAILSGDDLGSPRTREILTWGQYARLVPRWQKLFGEDLIVVGNGDLRGNEPEVLRQVTAHLEIGDELTTASPDETNVGATSMLEMRFMRQMRRAITVVDPVTLQPGPRTNNPVKLAYGGAMREAARVVHRRRPTKPDSMRLSPELRQQLTGYFVDDYKYVEDHFGVGL